MSELTILLSINPAQNRFRFFAIVLRRLSDGGAELHRRWGRLGTEGRHEVESFSTARLAEAARADLIARRRRRGYDIARSLPVSGDSEFAALAAWEVGLALALESMRRRLTARREEARAAFDSRAQLSLPI